MFDTCATVGNTPTTLVSKRFVLGAPLVAIAATVLGVFTSSYAFVSLQAGSLPFYWQNSTVTYAIHQAGDPRISDESDVLALRQAFQAWQDAPSSRIAFQEDTSSFTRSRTDWRADDLRLVIWDTDNESGFFGGNAGLVAITPVDFNPSTGQIIDADIIFNGKNYTFSTDLTGGTFDIQNVATHEVGHLIGLDHTAVVGATMNPFANTQDTRLRSLELDDLAAASSIYAIGGEPGSIRGTVLRDGNPVSGAHVVAEDMNGQPASAGLSDGSGAFRIRGLDQGTYVVYAEPLDGPVASNNFSLHTSNLVIDTGFGTTFYGSAGGRSSPANPTQVQVSFGQSTNIGTIQVLPKTTMNLTSASQLSLAPNTETILSLYGAGLGIADSVVISGPPGDGLFVGNVTYGSSSVRIELSVSPSTLPSLRSTRVFNANTWACAVLTGGLEIRSPAPLIEAVNPGETTPGQVVTLAGSNFEPGARALVGTHVVTTSGSGGEVSFTLPALTNGTYDVALENPDGQFAKVKQALTVQGGSSPTVASTGGSSGTTTTDTSGQTSGTAQPAAGAAAPAGGGGGGGGGGGCALRAARDGSAGSGPDALAALLVLLGLGALGQLRRRALQG